MAMFMNRVLQCRHEGFPSFLTYADFLRLQGHSHEDACLRAEMGTYMDDGQHAWRCPACRWTFVFTPPFCTSTNSLGVF